MPPKWAVLLSVAVYGDETWCFPFLLKNGCGTECRGDSCRHVFGGANARGIMKENDLIFCKKTIK